MLPSSRLETLVKVYKLLDRLNLHIAVRCVRLKVNQVEVALNRRMPKRSAGDSVHIELTLQPVGAQWSTPDDRELKILAVDLLRTLNEVHSDGVVHRDIRRENVVRDSHHWVLIDWELADFAGEYVWWSADNLPDRVMHNVEPFDKQADLWLVGRLILGLSSVDSGSNDIAARLQSGEYSSALEAIAAIQL